MSLLLALALSAAPGASTSTVVPDCDVHKFETPVTTNVNGQTKVSKVKICGHLGQTDPQWVETLKDARAKLAANVKMTASVKEQILPALDIEIARLAVAKPVSPATQTASPLPTAVLAQPPAVTGLAPPLRAPEAGRPLAEYSALPPLPAPLPPATTGALVAAAPSLPAPRLAFTCLATDSMAGEGPCDQLQRGMVVTVKAGEDLPGGTSLRFLRRGDNRAEVELASLRRGQSQHFALPPEVCAGVGGSRVEIQVVRSVGKTTQVVDTRGPFDLRC